MEVITFGDIEDALRIHLDSILTEPVSVGTPPERPAAFVALKRIGGPRKNLVTDSPTVQFECFAATGSAAHDLSKSVRGRVHALTGESISGILVTRVQEFAGPANLPDPESDQPRYVFTASLDVRYP